MKVKALNIIGHFSAKINEGGEDEDFGIEFGDTGETQASDKEESDDAPSDESDSSDEEDSDEETNEIEKKFKQIQVNLPEKHKAGHNQKRGGKREESAVDDVWSYNFNNYANLFLILIFL